MPGGGGPLICKVDHPELIIAKKKPGFITRALNMRNW
jgi:hypothetical protein